jgi:RNA polymerase sigma factor (sigma-70 family)
MSWPPFLDLIDDDPKKAFELFYRFAYRELTAIPPRPMRVLNPDDQQDLIHDIIYHCVRDSFKVLRQYKDVGKSFGAWLYRVAHNKALEYLRGKRKKWPILAEQINDDEAWLVERIFAAKCQNPNHVQELRELIAIVIKALGEIGRKCQILIEMAADEFTPKEMVAVLGLPNDHNKKISSDLRYCRRKLRDLLATKGLDIGKYI